MNRKMLYICVLLILFCHVQSCGQGFIKRWLSCTLDTNYVQNNQKDLVVRLYGSQKYSSQTIMDSGEKVSLAYRPSNGYVMGLGFNYKFLGVNIGTVFPFAKLDDSKYGSTKYLDLQSHLYLRFLTVDFFSGYYKGLYLSNTADVINTISGDTRQYIRGDISTISGGFGVYANLNPGRYSVRAPFLQNEWQKKSAGQPMIGLEAYWVSSFADSSFIPSQIINQNFFDGNDFNKWRFYSLNFTGGYAYTWVLSRRFFIMGSLNGSVGVGQYLLSPMDGEQLKRVYPNFSLNQKFGMGYHFGKYFVGMSLANFQYYTPTPIKQTYIRWSTGNLRFNIAYRISLKKEVEIRPWKWFENCKARE